MSVEHVTQVDSSQVVNTFQQWAVRHVWWDGTVFYETYRSAHEAREDLDLIGRADHPTEPSVVVSRHLYATDWQA